MPIIAKSTKQNFEVMESGSYPARIYQIIHIGTVPGFQGAMQNKVRITFEFPTELKVFKEENGEQPQVISQEYTLSFHEKSGLRKVIAACDPSALKKTDDEGFVEEYDIENLLGKACLVSVIHKDGKEGAVYANIDTCTPLPKGMTCPDQVNPSKSLSYDSFDEEFFNSLPEFIKSKMMSSVEYKTIVQGGKDDEEINLEDVPFD